MMLLQGLADKHKRAELFGAKKDFKATMSEEDSEFGFLVGRILNLLKKKQ